MLILTTGSKQGFVMSLFLTGKRPKYPSPSISPAKYATCIGLVMLSLYHGEGLKSKPS